MAMLAEEPHDVFLRYSLAMEHRSDGETQASLDLLDKLIAEQPPHVASFFMAAQQVAEQDQVERARAYLRDGIEAARDQGDGHAASEMSEFLMMLGDE